MVTPSFFPNCNNPSGATHPRTGRAYLLCHGGDKGYGPGFFLHSAPSWTSHEWAPPFNLFSSMTAGGGGTDGVREGSCEDPMLYICPRTGAFHVLAHCYSTTSRHRNDTTAYCSAHMFSVNGSAHTWHFMGDADAPYGFENVFSSRERPSLAIDSVTGAPLYLTTAVSLLGYDRSHKGRDWTWTYVARVN